MRAAVAVALGGGDRRLRVRGKELVARRAPALVRDARVARRADLGVQLADPAAVVEQLRDDVLAGGYAQGLEVGRG